MIDGQIDITRSVRIEGMKRPAVGVVGAQLDEPRRDGIGLVAEPAGRQDVGTGLEENRIVGKGLERPGRDLIAAAVERAVEDAMHVAIEQLLVLGPAQHQFLVAGHGLVALLGHGVAERLEPEAVAQAQPLAILPRRVGGLGGALEIGAEHLGVDQSQSRQGERGILLHGRREQLARATELVAPARADAGHVGVEGVVVEGEALRIVGARGRLPGRHVREHAGEEGAAHAPHSRPGDRLARRPFDAAPVDQHPVDAAAVVGDGDARGQSVVGTRGVHHVEPVGVAEVGRRRAVPHGGLTREIDRVHDQAGVGGAETDGQELPQARLPRVGHVTGLAGEEPYGQARRVGGVQAPAQPRL